jgi:hypothetical protein
MAEHAVNGGKKSNQKAFPVWPQYDDAERKSLQDVLDSRVNPTDEPITSRLPVTQSRS